VNIEGFHDIDVLPTGAIIISSIGIDFNDKTQPALFDISFDGRQLSTPLSIACHVGEVIEPKFLNEQEFNQNLSRLRGMNEIIDNIDISEVQMKKLNFTTLQTKVVQCANVSSVPSGSGDSTTYRYEQKKKQIFRFNNFFISRFSGQTISSKSLILLTIQLNIPESIINLTINADRIVLATMLLKEIKQTLSSV
jgi:hypothetical protein